MSASALDLRRTSFLGRLRKSCAMMVVSCFFSYSLRVFFENENLLIKVSKSLFCSNHALENNHFNIYIGET